MNSLAILLLLCLFSLSLNRVFGGELVYDRVELMNGTYQEGIYNYTEIRIFKFNRTTYALKADVELYVDFDDEFQFEGIFYYNRLSNNQYTKSLISIQRDTVCNASKKFKTLLPHSEEGTSNIIGNDIDYCPLKKGRYWAKNHRFGKDLPPLFQDGNWKIELLIYHNDVQIWGARAYFKVVTAALGAN